MIKFLKRPWWHVWLHFLDTKHDLIKIIMTVCIALSLFSLVFKIRSAEVFNFRYIPAVDRLIVESMGKIPGMSTARFSVENPIAIPALIEQLSDGTASRQRFSAFSLACRGMEAGTRLTRLGEQAIPALIMALRDTRPMVRGNAALALGSIGKDSTVGFLTPLLRDSDPVVRLKTVVALGNIRDSLSTGALVQVVSNESDPEVKGAAIQALANRHNADARKVIALARHDPHWYVRSEAITALRQQ